MKIKFIVKYVDDNYRTHITFVQTVAEVTFIRDRYRIVTVQSI